MNNFKKVLKNKNASNILINEIKSVSEHLETMDTNKLNKFAMHSKEMQASLDDLSRTTLEVMYVNYNYNQSIKIEDQSINSYKAKGLMLNILESGVNTKLMIDDINEVNNQLNNESLDSLTIIKDSIDRISNALNCLLNKIKEMIDEKNFNPVDFVENLLNSYIVNPSENVTKKENIETSQKDSSNTKQEDDSLDKKTTLCLDGLNKIYQKHQYDISSKENAKIKEKDSININQEDDSLSKKMIMCLDSLENICQKYQYDISFYNLNAVRNSILTGELDKKLHIQYLYYIYNTLSQNIKIEIEDILDFESKLIDAINFEENYCREDSVLSKKQINGFRDDSSLFNTQTFKPRGYLNFV